MIRIRLAPGREKLALNRHPWVFSGAIAHGESKPAPGQIVSVHTDDGRFIAYAQFNPSSKIRLRLMEWNEKTPVDEAWYRRRIGEALDLRRALVRNTDAQRLFFSEADGIPGLIADRFGSFLVLQFLTAGAEAVKPLLTDLFQQLVPGLSGIVEKSDGDGRRMEGLGESHGLLWGEQPDQSVEILENGCRFLVDLGAQKTGFYADQRENRAFCAPLAAGKDMLDAFCFTGGFAAACLKAGARSATLLDASADALALARQNLERNGFTAKESLEGDAFELLRMLAKRGDQFGLVVLDPPKLATSRENLERAMRGYKDLNLQGLKLVESGGYLATFSCSGLVTQAAFREVVAFAVKDSGRRADIVAQLHQAPCHPIRTSFPESEYLKGLVLRIL